MTDHSQAAHPGMARPLRAPHSLTVGIARVVLALCTRLVTAVRPVWRGTAPSGAQRVYFANHTSNADTAVIWTALPARLRKRTRPVAAQDYWLKSPLRRFFARDVLNAVLIDRTGEGTQGAAVDRMARALDHGVSLILFPEGRRNVAGGAPLPFRTGMFHLAQARPEVEFLPVWIDNLNAVLPKGEIVPVPLVCSATFGAPLRIGHGEDREAFLDRARAALADLMPREEARDAG